MINAFMIVIGDTVDLDYSIDEDSKSYNYQIELASGDAFVISSDV